MLFLTRLRIGWLATCVVASVTILAAVGYRAIAEWQRSAALLAQRHADAAADQLVTAITRDMRGVQASVLSALHVEEMKPTVLLDLNGVGSAFTRYPYAELFFASGERAADPESMTFYSRAERPPLWLPKPDEPSLFPVTRTHDRRASALLFERIDRSAAEGRRFATFDLNMRDVSYQVIALLTYADATHDRLESIVGFAVNLDWVRQNYFQELVAQVLRMHGPDAGLATTVFDAHGTPVVAGAAGDGPSSSRSFPMLFFDPSLVALDPPADLTRDFWTARTAIAGDRTLVAARVGARRTLTIAAVSAIVLAIGFAFTVQAVRANARLTAMRSEFVSAVTHELKAPIATIRAASETLASGRLDLETSREYGQLAVHEVKRLTRLVDNLLAYARITDLTEAYSFELLDMRILAQQSVKEFSSQLAAAGFSVTVNVPAWLPPVRADRPSIALALGNLVDNAIRYSTNARMLTLAASATNGSVVLDVTDAGIGIPPDEIPHVTHRFFRGNGAVAGGSGLGLSIVQRIVADHAGKLSITSEVGVGTTVRIVLPSAGVDREATHTDC
jgi:signal transduction histidine kinase